MDKTTEYRLQMIRVIPTFMIYNNNSYKIYNRQKHQNYNTIYNILNAS